MNRKNRELGVLRSIRFLGWLLFGGLVFSSVNLKGGGVSNTYLFFTLIGVCLLMTALYYFFFNRIFVSVSKNDSATYFIPYRLGTLLLLGLLMLFAVIAVYAR
ncbi:hypothetical protein [Sessilibacter corallicola]|uniref:hypothetical protein n=1 Tax=Sessilibacter corallicola TaxID=2904075 RepID=UPI001E29B4D5|nr:hypothetical protein [Sessilibacter corallicola]MCE2029809.1 hypothetical protein [Sessilibacter corallicola]